MTRRTLKRPQAERDIEDAFIFIGEKDINPGLDFLHAVEESLELLADNPHIGSLRSFAAPELTGIRMWHVKTYDKYLVFYTIGDKTIDVIRVIHSALDYARVFNEKGAE